MESMFSCQSNSLEKVLAYMTACGTNDMNRICTDRDSSPGPMIKAYILKGPVQNCKTPLPIAGHTLDLSDLLAPFPATASPIPRLFPIQMLMTRRHRVIIRGPRHLACQLFEGLPLRLWN